MTPEQYKRIGELYHEALAREPDERAAYLAEASAGDEESRRQVEALLAAHEQAGEFLTAPDPSLLNPTPDDRKPEAAAGLKLGQYEVISLLGAGGMGEVYLARDTRLSRLVALKLLPAEYTQDADRVRRFKQEAHAASGANHPNIITIFDIGEAFLEEGIKHYIATEYIDGQTLRGRLFGSPMKLREALDVIAQVASAVAAAHDAGVVHRDIKPENIMIRRDGYVKVLDFGLAKLRRGGEGEWGRQEPPFLPLSPSPLPPLSHSPTPPLSTPGMVMGTFAYMSPEQARGQEVDGRSDIFSLGTVLYEMIAGRVPFDGKSPADVIAAVLNHEVWPLTGVPAELER